MNISKYIATLTVRDVATDAWPSGWEDASLYVFRDGETVFYVGKSVDIWTRVTEHVTGDRLLGGWGGYVSLTELIEDNLKQSLDWQIELYAPVECDDQHAEATMIRTLGPVLNSMHNSSAKPLPERYKTEAWKARKAEREAAAMRAISDLSYDVPYFGRKGTQEEANTV